MDLDVPVLSVVMVSSLLLVMLQAYCGCWTDFKQRLQSDCNIFCINSHLFTMP